MPNPGDPPSQLDFIFRQIQTRFDQQQRAIDDLANLLRGFTSQQIAAFDLSGTPQCYNVLQQSGGSWKGIKAGGASQTNYVLFDQSALTPGSPSIGITNGNHYDSTGGATWIPTINDFAFGPTAINVTVGSPARAPALIISPSATMAYFKQTVKARDGSAGATAGAMTAFEVDADSGSGLPTPNTLTLLYTICQMLKVNGPDGSGNYTVTNKFGGVLGSQVYQQCGGGSSGNNGSPLYGLQ